MNAWKPRVERVVGREEDPADEPLDGRLGGRVGLVRGLLRGQDIVGARRELDRLLSLDSNNAAVRMIEAQVLQEEGERAAALAALDQAIALAPLETGPHLRLGRLRLEADEMELARAAFLRALDLDPGSVQALMGLARVDEKSGNTEDALRRSEEAVRRDPERVPARMALARLYGRLGRRADAAAQVRAVLAINPDHERAAAMLTRLERRGRERDEGAPLLENDAPVPQDSEENQTDGEAEAALRARLVESPDNRAATARLARLLLARGDLDEARVWVARLPEDGRFKPVRRQMEGDLAFAAGDTPRAIICYEEALATLDQGRAALDRLRSRSNRQETEDEQETLARRLSRITRHLLREEHRAGRGSGGDGEDR